MQTRLRAERIARGLRQKDVAKACGTNPANLLRIEQGKQVAKAPLARALFEYYGGAIPLGAIYDPAYSRERGLDGLPVGAMTVTVEAKDDGVDDIQR